MTIKLSELEAALSIASDIDAPEAEWSVSRDDVIAALPALIAIAKAALEVERTKSEYLDGGWLTDEAPSFAPYMAALDAYRAALREVSP